MRSLRKLLFLLPALAVSTACTGELLVDDFADGDLESPLGLPWMVIGDDLMGGGSKATLAVESPGESQVMVLDGRLDVPEALPISFVGAWTAVGGDGLPRDFVGVPRPATACQDERGHLPGGR